MHAGARTQHALPCASPYEPPRLVALSQDASLAAWTVLVFVSKRSTPPAAVMRSGRGRGTAVRGRARAGVDARGGTFLAGAEHHYGRPVDEEGGVGFLPGRVRELVV